MDISRRRKVPKVATGSLTELYPHNLQMYFVPPISDITLSAFEELALERLKVLRCIELANLKGANKFSDEWKAALCEELTKQGLKHIFKISTAPTCKQTEAEVQYRKRDHLSHFILRLAYCRTDDLRRWFIARELDLFKLRFMSLNAEEVRAFLNLNNLCYSPISSEEKETVKEGLCDSTYNMSMSLLSEKDFFRVPFTDVLELVRSRKVFVHAGFAYIPSSEFVAVMSSVFRASLGQALMMTYRRLPSIDDERLAPLLKGLHTSYAGDDFKTPKGGEICIEDLDKHAKTSYPLCMRFLHDALRANHHLRHLGRLQYGLFLKGIGVTLQDAMRFWRDEFTKSMDVEKFEKQYAYNVRYNYGQEGKRTNYTPYSCMKIICSSVGPGDFHGCPYKHSDVKILANKLQAYGLSPQYVAEISDLVKNSHYQVACGRYFEATHGKPSSGIQHPNQYFEESQVALGNKPGIKVESGSQSSTQSSTQSSYGHTPTNKSVKIEKAEEEDMWGGDIDLASINMDVE
ncbi:DNA primase large subunit-like [Thrips palmi]|uniref:DNA primase large subunit n=1 Tax=Thrips palmi TaxID=161013 RepID=A0A6P8YNE1_THRPL|nr:DNA primase large subunit-like [Thrips palmi]